MRIPFIFSIAICSLALASPRAMALEHHDVVFADQIELGGQTLAVRGAHRFVWGLWTIHVSALYAPSDLDSAALLSGEHPMALEVCYRRSFDREEQREALIESLNEVHGEERGAALEAWAEDFAAGYPEEVEKGDRLVYRFLPGQGLTLLVGEEAASSVADDGFATAVFAIWIGPDAVDDDMSEDLLGGVD